ncbi:MAG: hypothetical protein LBQ22_09120 [Bacteroidales bacterium]|jgi:hypothetical protein|nr:hypothetical protein [Bacteroidales bacterium]
MKQLSLIGLILLLLIGLVGCDKEGQEIDSEKLCSYLNTENINKTVPIINDYLASLKSNLNDEEKLQSLTEWLKSSSCVIDATILCVSCIETLPEQSEISFSFIEGEVIKVVTLDISMSNPLKAEICKIQGASNETNVTLKNTESYSRTFVLGDEEGASITVQTQHYEESELVRDESTNMNVEYRYKPTTGFVGNDYVILEVYYNKTGENSSAYTETEKINFTITN